MSATRDPVGAARQPSPGYLISLALACVGLPFLGIGLGATLKLRSGGDPMDAVEGSGFYSFILAFALMFLARLIFWPRIAPPVQNVVRLAISAALCLALLGTLLSIGLVLSGPAHPAPVAGRAFLAPWFTALAAACQVATVVWLVRYRQL